MIQLLVAVCIFGLVAQFILPRVDEEDEHRGVQTPPEVSSYNTNIIMTVGILTLIAVVICGIVIVFQVHQQTNNVKEIKDDIQHGIMSQLTRVEEAPNLYMKLISDAEQKMEDNFRKHIQNADSLLEEAKSESQRIQQQSQYDSNRIHQQNQQNQEILTDFMRRFENDYETKQDNLINLIKENKDTIQQTAKSIPEYLMQSEDKLKQSQKELYNLSKEEREKHMNNLMEKTDTAQQFINQRIENIAQKQTTVINKINELKEHIPGTEDVREIFEKLFDERNTITMSQLQEINTWIKTFDKKLQTLPEDLQQHFTSFLEYQRKAQNQFVETTLRDIERGITGSIQTLFTSLHQLTGKHDELVRQLDKIESSLREHFTSWDTEKHQIFSKIEIMRGNIIKDLKQQIHETETKLTAAIKQNDVSENVQTLVRNLKDMKNQLAGIKVEFKSFETKTNQTGRDMIHLQQAFTTTQKTQADELARQRQLDELREQQINERMNVLAAAQKTQQQRFNEQIDALQHQAAQHQQQQIQDAERHAQQTNQQFQQIQQTQREVDMLRPTHTDAPMNDQELKEFDEIFAELKSNWPPESNHKLERLMNLWMKLVIRWKKGDIRCEELVTRHTKLSEFRNFINWAEGSEHRQNLQQLLHTALPCLDDPRDMRVQYNHVPEGTYAQVCDNKGACVMRTQQPVYLPKAALSDSGGPLLYTEQLPVLEDTQRHSASSNQPPVYLAQPTQSASSNQPPLTIEDYSMNTQLTHSPSTNDTDVMPEDTPSAHVEETSTIHAPSTNDTVVMPEDTPYEDTPLTNELTHGSNPDPFYMQSTNSTRNPKLLPAIVDTSMDTSMDTSISSIAPDSPARSHSSRVRFSDDSIPPQNRQWNNSGMTRQRSGSRTPRTPPQRRWVIKGSVPEDTSLSVTEDTSPSVRRPRKKKNKMEKADDRRRSSGESVTFSPKKKADSNKRELRDS